MATTPTISGTQSGQITTYDQPIDPFSTVAISDPTQGATDTVYISFYDPSYRPTLEDGPGFSALAPQPFDFGLAHSRIQRYMLSGTSAQVTAEVDALVYTPGQTYSTAPDPVQFYISVLSSSGASSPNDGATTVQDLSPDVLTINPAVTYVGSGVFEITGQTKSITGVVDDPADLTFSALVNGQRESIGSATLSLNGTYVFDDAVGAATQRFIEATYTDAAGQQTTTAANFDLTGGVTNRPFVAVQNSYTDDGSALLSTTWFHNDGSRAVLIEESGQVLHSHESDTFLNHRTPDDTFVFDPGYGLDIVRGFRVGGVDHDTISLPSSSFTSISDVLHNTQSMGGSTIITDPSTGDTIRIVGITKAQIAANQTDLTFHA